MACPVCQQWRAENPLIVFEALDFRAIGERLGDLNPRSGTARRRIPASERVSVKRCSVCGAVGHNRRACPVVRARAAAEAPAEPDGAAKKRRKPLDPAHKQCAPRPCCVCADVGVQLDTCLSLRQGGRAMHGPVFGVTSVCLVA